MQLITQKSFSDLLASLNDFTHEKKLAVAVSGGCDSIALGYLLSQFAKKNEIDLHILTVDHGLRAESKKEARKVAQWVVDWPQVTHKILNWAGDKPKARIQEEARKARYALMSKYCQKQKIKYLFLAHHGDDQVETFLFRLAKGSGVDGLSVMPALQKQKDVTLVRPCLSLSHEDLIAVCKKNRLEWIEDPSNISDKYARVRLRQSKEVLEREGLTVERVLTLTKRLERVRNALEQVTEKEEKNCTLKVATQRIEIDFLKLKALPKEIGLRIIQNAIGRISGPRPYPPSLQILEQITDEIYDGDDFKASTLAGCVIRHHKAKKIISVSREKPD